jgi:hypothetical protein
MSPLRNRYTLGFAVALGLTLAAGVALRSVKPEGIPTRSAQRTVKSAVTAPSVGSSAVKAKAIANYGKLPLSFEVNRGQAGKDVKFLTRGQGYALLLTGQDAVLSLSSPKAEVSYGSGPHSRPPLATAEKRKVATDVLRMKLLNASQASAPTGFDELPGKVNYFIGNDPKKWRTNIPTYAKVRYKNVYPGIDLVYYGNQGQLEYDFVVAPGADPGLIALAFESSTHQQRVRPPRIDEKGNVLIGSGSSVLQLNQPVIYQPKRSTTSGNSEFAAGDSKPVNGRFVLTASNRIRFELGPYDKSQPLVIDPALVYSTFLGFQGSGASVAADASGNLFIAGSFPGTGFAATSGASNTTAGVAFVAKVNSSGSALLYSTYFGGTTSSGIGGESGPFLALDSSGDVYLTGYATATDFPVTSGAFQTTLKNTTGCIPYVSKLNPAGSKLVYSTYLGGTMGINVGYAITVDSAGDAYVVGMAGGADFPTTPEAFQTVNNGGAASGIAGDAFLTELKPDGSAPVFSTFLGGTGANLANSVVVDGTGIYVGGTTTSTDFPTKNPYQATLSGTQDGFITKFASGGSSLVYSTYIGSGGAGVVAVDPLGDAYIAAGDIYAKMNASGSALIYSAPALSVGSGFAVDASENMYVAGVTNTAGLPVANAIQDTYNGGNDCYIGVVNLKTSGLVFGTYLGGSEREFGCGAALDSTGHLYITGWTASVNFPLLPGGLSSSFTCCTNAFLAKIDLSSAATPVASVTPTNLTFQGTTGGMQTVTVKNTGTTALNVSQVGFQVPSNSFSETDTCTGSSIAAGASCSVDVTFTPQTAENDPGLLSITYNGAGSPQFVVLTVVDFSFTPSANSLTLKAGQSGTFNLLVLPLGGLSGTTVNISCTGAPSKSTCAPSSNSVALDGLHGGIVTVNVSTTASTAGLLRAPGPAPFSLATILLLPMGLVAFSLTSLRRRTVQPALWVLALVLVSLSFLPSCGGGGGGNGGGGGGGATGTPPGNYTLTVTGSSGNLSHSTTVSLTVN